jgi:hypothetical protein
LQELLSHGLSRELQFFGEVGDGGRSPTFERDKNRAPTVGKLIYGDDGDLLLKLTSIKV